MKLTVAVYNVEWMKRLFATDGEPKTTGDDGERSTRLATVVKAIDPDILGVVEGPGAGRRRNVLRPGNHARGLGG